MISLTLEQLKTGSQSQSTFKAGRIIMSGGEVKSVAVISFERPLAIGELVESSSHKWQVYDKMSQSEVEAQLPEFRGVVRNVHHKDSMVTGSGTPYYVNYLTVL